MTKFSISASRSQAQAAAKACSNLKSDVNQLMNKVNSFGAENFEGAAADNAQRYAEAVIMPLLRGASALFDDIPIAMKRLPGEYEGKVDHKSWSTEKLKAKIKQYETAAKKAQKAADAANKLAQKASGMGTVGAGIMAAASKCAAGFEKGMASAQKAIAKFKKILDDFDRFDIFSPTIFNEIATLESNLNKGQKVANGAYNPSSHQFSIPKESELNWAKELNGTYAEHQNKISGRIKNAPDMVVKKFNGIFGRVKTDTTKLANSTINELMQIGRQEFSQKFALKSMDKIGTLLILVGEKIKNNAIVKYCMRHDIPIDDEGNFDKLMKQSEFLMKRGKEFKLSSIKISGWLDDELFWAIWAVNSLFEGIDLAREGNNIVDVVTKASVHGFNDTVLTFPEDREKSKAVNLRRKFFSAGLSSETNEEFDEFYKKYKKEYYKGLRSNPNTPIPVSPTYK